MAIKINTELKGLQIQDAYCRVRNIKLSKNSVSFILSKYANSGEALSLDGEEYACAYDILGENPFKQAYEYLKTLPEFADAVDV